MAIRITGLNSGLDTEALVSALVSAYRYKSEKYTKAQTKLSWKQDAWKSLNSKIYSLYTSMGSMRYSSAYSSNTTSVSDTTKATVTASSSAPTGTQTLEVTQLAKAGYLTGSKLSTTDSSTLSASSTLASLGFSGSASLSLTVGSKTSSISVSDTTTISSFISQLQSAGVSATFDSTNSRIFVSSPSTGAANNFTLTSSDASGASALSALGLGASSTKVDGQDATIKLNGAEFTSATNKFSINGLSINALSETSSAISITTALDTDGMYTKIKSFLTSYNSLMNEMTSLYNASSSKGYEPLTSTEKDAMSDTDVAAWEKKIKDSLLRRDDTLSSVMSTMQSAMYSTYTDADGKKYSLSSFGIQTLGILNSTSNEENAFHIDGDSSDSTTSGKTDKLKAAINSDPDSVVDFMKNLATTMYKNLDVKMKSSSLKSAYTVYNDKQMAQEYSDYTTTISDWEDKLSTMEDYYYKKFAAMESALATLQSQQSSLASMLG